MAKRNQRQRWNRAAHGNRPFNFENRGKQYPFLAAQVLFEIRAKPEENTPQCRDRRAIAAQAVRGKSSRNQRWAYLRGT